MAFKMPHQYNWTSHKPGAAPGHTELDFFLLLTSTLTILWLENTLNDYNLNLVRFVLWLRIQSILAYNLWKLARNMDSHLQDEVQTPTPSPPNDKTFCNFANFFSNTPSQSPRDAESYNHNYALCASLVHYSLHLFELHTGFCSIVRCTAILNSSVNRADGPFLIKGSRPSLGLRIWLSK